ncbi:hypothetical protein [Clostridium tagluense]|uniref:hypothetical protein n=1 Tax=Clostridium tagluense TaxID=360422 RepID=UPI001C6DFCBF|nr:hypothetical protein [Clostridium tagluense]MBW9159780.1 hypothetical protein [Clostridium tagluense]WLC68212.1 hypothetical protein KTC93_23955 [Clostridium tagluense]
MKEKRSEYLHKIGHFRLVMLSIFGCFLGAIGVTGVATYERFVPLYLIIALAVTGGIVLILSIAILIIKNQVR